jgi:Ca-activated chloride channel family protein
MTLRSLLVLPVAVTLSLSVLLAGCSRSPDTNNAAPADNANTFHILAASELKDLEPDLTQSAQAVGVSIKIDYAGSLEMVDRINAHEPFDAILPASSAYPMLALNDKPKAQDKLFYSKIALGVKTSKAQQLGWITTPPTWAKVVNAVQSGQFRYGMTNPIASNSGMSALFALTLASAGKADNLQASDIKKSVLQQFLKGQALTAGSSGWLADTYIQEQNRLDGLINYEAVLMRLNQQPQLQDKLSLIYPQDGVISADYPLMLLNDAHRTDYQKLVARFKAPAFQTVIAQRFLRPANPAVKSQLPATSATELSYPNQLSTIDAVLTAYQQDSKKPSTTIYVLDTSGSMEGARMSDLKHALNYLTGLNATSLTERLTRFQPREQLIFLPFSSEVKTAQTLVIDPKQPDVQRQAISTLVNQLYADGGTALYDALDQAVQIALLKQHANPEQIVSIVLMTDGVQTEGQSFAQWQAQSLPRLQSQHAPIRIFPILFGEAPTDELSTIAQESRGKTFESRQDNLSKAFRDIRAYQ